MREMGEWRGIGRESQATIERVSRFLCYISGIHEMFLLEMKKALCAKGVLCD